jgi:hypothetical protein
LCAILQTAWGWALGGLIFMTNYLMYYFVGHKFTIFLVVAVTLMDAFWGIVVSYRQGRFTLSELARLTIAKLAVYGCALFVFAGLDRVVDATFTTAIVGSAIVLVEFWSSCGSMLILFPNFLFLKILRKALTGEIAAKLHVSEDEVETVLYGTKKSN